MILPKLNYINECELPKSYYQILSQQLLTIAIADYYQRTPKLRKPLAMSEDLDQKNISRTIAMIVDKNSDRDNALIADTLAESLVVELAQIEIYLNHLPEEVITGVYVGEIPLGILLIENNISTYNIDLKYFEITCNEYLSKIFDCKAGEILYGRVNTLVRDDNHSIIANVIEILNIL